MSKFNTIIKEKSVTLNYEGAEAFKLSAEMELYTAVVTASLSNKFYETTDERIERIVELVGKCDARFVAQLAIYARTKMNLRSVPLLLVVELAKHHSGDNLVSKTVEKVVLRAIANLMVTRLRNLADSLIRFRWDYRRRSTISTSISLLNMTDAIWR